MASLMIKLFPKLSWLQVDLFSVGIQGLQASPQPDATVKIQGQTLETSLSS